MLKRYKNDLHQMVQRKGLNLDDFTSNDDAAGGGSGVFTIGYRPAQLSFNIYPDVGNPHSFHYRFNVYNGWVPAPFSDYEPDSNDGLGFERLLLLFMTWLDQQVGTAIEEALMPDLWAEASGNFAVPIPIADDDTHQFSAEEKEQIKLGIDTFRLLVRETFDPTPDQWEVVSKQLAYLTAAVDRLNRFDWKSVAITAVMSISTALTLDVDKGRLLYGLFQQSFTAFMHLLK